MSHLRARYFAVALVAVHTFAISAQTQRPPNTTFASNRQALVMPYLSEQDPQEPDPEKAALAALRRRKVPEASLPCSPAEAEWWERVRTASTKIQNHRGGGIENLMKLLQEGRDNSYKVPIPNRGITILQRAPPNYTEEARRQGISGSIAMVAELKSDATVGEVKVVEGLAAGLDESAIEAARSTVFLPAVKDGQFVTVRIPMTMTFSIR